MSALKPHPGSCGIALPGVDEPAAFGDFVLLHARGVVAFLGGGVAFDIRILPLTAGNSGLLRRGPHLNVSLDDLVATNVVAHL